MLSEIENKDPQLCPTFACDIYNHLRAAEVYIFFSSFSMVVGKF